MNRFVPCDDEQISQAFLQVDVTSDPSVPQHSGDHTFPLLDHALFGPMHYEPKYSYPLVVWIHGPEDDERQLNQVMPHISLRNYVGVSPRGTASDSRYSASAAGFDWEQSPSQIVTAVDRVLDCVELACMRFNISRKKIFLAGYESGGTMAMRIAMESPQTFAGVASFNGPLPSNHKPFRNVANFRQLPMMMGFGRDALDYCSDQLSRDLRLVHAAGLSYLNIRQYPCGDELVTQMLKDFDVWMMEIVTGSHMDTTVNTMPRFDNWN